MAPIILKLIVNPRPDSAPKPDPATPSANPALCADNKPAAHSADTSPTTTLVDPASPAGQAFFASPSLADGTPAELRVPAISSQGQPRAGYVLKLSQVAQDRDR